LKQTFKCAQIVERLPCCVFGPYVLEIHRESGGAVLVSRERFWKGAACRHRRGRRLSSHAHTDVFKLLSGSLLAKAFGLASTMLFARVLTKNQMAVFPAYLMLAGLPNLILTFGIFSTFMRELPSLVREDYARARSLIATGSLVIVIGTIIPSIATFYWSDAIAVFAFRDASLGWIVRIMVPGFMAFVLSKIIECVMGGRGQFGATSKVQIIESVLRPCLTITLFLAMGYKGIVIGLVVAQFAMVFVGLYYVRDLLAGPIPAPYPIRQLVAESMPYYIGNYISFMRGEGDTLFVSTLLGPVALAEYYIAKNLYSNVLLVQTAVDRVVVERLARFRRSEEFSAKVNQANTQISQMAIPFMLLTIALAPNALVVLAGPHYGAATWTATVLLVAALVQFVAIPIDRAVFLSLSGFYRVAYGALEAAVIIAVVFTLVPRIGLAGMGVARVIAPVGVFVFGLALLKSKLGLTLSFDAAAASIAAALPGTILILLMAPRAHNSIAALGAVAVETLVWSTLFIGLTYIINRSMFDKISWEALRRWQALVAR
jgi:O-antigen/teichoic acid export membrane protein